jgi:hypothetical protein
MRRPLYKWRVTHPEHGSVEAAGTCRYDVVIVAAGKWRVPWTSIARECDFEKLEETEAEKCKKEPISL